jgi:glycosyltransferase involved in cell wall biosynthesis
MSPEITVAIATFNSMRTLPKILSAVRKQNISQEKIEILLVDGGSIDETVKYGLSMGARILNNPHTEPVSAKHLALLHAEAPLLMYLDHDEELEQTNIIQNILSVFQSDIAISAVLLGGYTTPINSPEINAYFNEFGDPFSCYFYHQTKEFKRFEKVIPNFWSPINSFGDNIIFEPKPNLARRLLVELVAIGSSIRRDHFLMNIPELAKDKWEIPHLYYYALDFPKVRFGLIRNASIAHHSLDSVETFKKKIDWRVVNNIFGTKGLGRSGFTGRIKHNRMSMFKKLCYLPYVFLFIPVFFHAIYLALTRRRFIYLRHVSMSYFTASLIVKYSILKFLKFVPTTKNYDGSLNKKKAE